jgi:GST-like protein
MPSWIEENKRLAIGCAVGATVSAVAIFAHRRITKYKPPKTWKHVPSGGKFSSINQPTAGARETKDLPVGKHPLQLYSLATPNGVKVTMLLEELGVDYDAWLINIMKGEQFTSGFVGVNPNSKIPAAVDRSTSPPTRIFESGSILLYLADKHGKFIPTDPTLRAECINWVMWQMGAGPYLGGGFGHFTQYAPEKMQYPIDRFSMEVKRQCDVLDKHLATHKYMCGDEYTIADIAIWPWYGSLVLGKLYTGSVEFLELDSYKNLVRWTNLINDRPGTQRGRMVNRSWGPLNEQLRNRHEPSDFETSTQDKIEKPSA